MVSQASTSGWCVPFRHPPSFLISEESCMETSIGYENTIIPKVLYPVNGKSGIKWLEIGKKIRDRWG